VLRGEEAPSKISFSCCEISPDQRSQKSQLEAGKRLPATTCGLSPDPLHLSACTRCAGTCVKLLNSIQVMSPTEKNHLLEKKE